MGRRLPTGLYVDKKGARFRLRAPSISLDITGPKEAVQKEFKKAALHWAIYACAEGEEKLQEQIEAWYFVLTQDRGSIIEHLEAASIQCYEHESLWTLQEALAINIQDGTIPIGDNA